MRYLGIDFGLRRIGLAVSEGSLASPLQTIKVKSFQNAVEKILELVKRENYEEIIIGLPEGKIGKTVSGFIKALRKSGLKVKEADETLSSKDALRVMIDQGIPKGKRKVNDEFAAAIILQNYIDSQI